MDFKGDRIRGTTSFGGEVKLSDLCRKILSYVNDPCGVWQILRDKINGRFSPSFSLLR
jgi:hypothetical protein